MHAVVQHTRSIAGCLEGRLRFRLEGISAVGLSLRRLRGCRGFVCGVLGAAQVGEKQLQLHVTVKEVKQIFLWSRMRACPDHSDHSEIKLRHLTFEDFMEALVRLAAIMAFPTDQEVEETGKNPKRA